MIEIKPLKNGVWNRFWNKNLKLHQASLWLIVMGFHHGAQTLEYRTIDGVFRVGERIDGILQEYPEPTDIAREDIFEFFRSHFRLKSDHCTVEAALIGHNVALEFEFITADGLNIRFIDGEFLTGKCGRILEEFHSVIFS